MLKALTDHPRWVMTCVLAAFLAVDPSPANGQTGFRLSQTDTARWYRGNMHTHSLWSDGDDYPEMIADWYRQQGYQFLVFTDHNVLHRAERWINVDKNKGGRVAFDILMDRFGKDWVDVRTKDGKTETRLKTFDETFEHFFRPGEYLLIQGEEISDRFRTWPVHLCATNVSEVMPPMKGDSVYEVMQNNINAAVSRRERTGEKTLVHLNHPNFGYAVTAEQLMKVQGENFFEVYNGHPSVANSGDADHASTERMWDIINTFRTADLQLPLMYGLATDDGHDYHRTKAGQGAQPGRGWVMVLANQLDPDALVDSLEAGRFYSSSGVSLKDITITSNSMSVEVNAQDNQRYRIDFIGTRTDFDRSSKPATDDETRATQLTRIYSDDVGAVLKSVTGTQASYSFSGDELYVRAVITSSASHPNPGEAGEYQKAWVQPISVATVDSQ